MWADVVAEVDQQPEDQVADRDLAIMEGLLTRIGFPRRKW